MSMNKYILQFSLCLAFTHTVFGISVKLGMLMPFRHPRLGWENNAAAATIAVERAQGEGLLVGHNISVLWRDDTCDATGGVAAAMLFREIDDVDVFIGPPCSGSTTPTGLLASFWNLPVYSQASSDPNLADKNVFKTLVRLGPPFNKMGKALVEMFQHFNWETVVMVTKRKTDNRNVFCDYSARSVVEEFRNNDIAINDNVEINPGISDDEITAVLNRIKGRGRIVLLCTEITSDRRRFLLRAREEGMTDGSYVYILPDHLPPNNVERPWVNHDEYDGQARLAFNSAFQITVAEMAGPEVESFRDIVTVKMAEAPWFYNQTMSNNLRGSEYSAFLHDVVYLYMLVLNETLAEGADHRNGTDMFERAKGKIFRGITGNVKVDNNGDREPDYWIWDLVPGENTYKVSLEASLTSSEAKKIKVLKPIVWETLDGKPPPSTPVCGFFNELCPVNDTPHTTTVIVCAVVATFVLVGLVMGVIMYRKAVHEKMIQQQLWRVNIEDLQLTNNKVVGSISMISLRTPCLSFNTTTSDLEEGQVFSQIGLFKGNVVAVKRLDKYHIQLESYEHKELTNLRNIHHENVNVFVGLCLDERFPCILTTYCTKGSVEDIIENDDIKLNWFFKISLLKDLVNAMLYLHSCPVRLHGNLKSSNCIVDNRWVLKVTDFGLSRIRQQHRYKNRTDYAICRGLFWTAPEILRADTLYKRGTQKGDIYSFGIIMFELLYRHQPYDTILITPNEVINKVKQTSPPHFRPPCLVSTSSVPHKLDDKIIQCYTNLMESCWAEEPSLRPPFTYIKQETGKLHQGKKLNIVDNMVMMLEKYANNLEEIVEQRTEELVAEKRKTDTLLYRMLPTQVAERLKIGEVVEPELFEGVTIYFSDIVGFTALSSESTPMQIVDFLNDLYTKFDTTVSKWDVYKVETIGDAYMCVSGLPVRNGQRHCTEIAYLALDLLACTSNFQIRHLPDRQLKLRIGMHTGPCAAGVIGRTMPRYCLFGDTVNTASRMESTGQAMRIHMSQSSRDILAQHEDFVIEKRGLVELKGKGLQNTYWLLGNRRHYMYHEDQVNVDI